MANRGLNFLTEDFFNAIQVQNIQRVSEILTPLSTDEKKALINNFHEGQYALFKAVVTGNQQILDLLIANGGDIKLRLQGITLLHCAAVNGHLRLVSVLLRSGLEVDVMDTNGNTALYQAVYYAKNCTDAHGFLGYFEVIKLLLASGANPHMLNRGGSSPFLEVNEAETNDYAQRVLELFTVHHPRPALTQLHTPQLRPFNAVQVQQGMETPDPGSVGNSPAEVASP